MKKLSIVAIVALVMVAFAAPSFAAKNYKILGTSYQQITGKVLSLMPEKGSVMVKDNEDGKEIHIHVFDAVLAELKVGDEIKFYMQGGECVITDVKR